MVFQHRNNVWKTAIFNHDENMDHGYLFIGDDMLLKLCVCVCVSSDTPTLKRETLYVSQPCIFNNKCACLPSFSDCCAFSLNRIVIYFHLFALFSA